METISKIPSVFLVDDDKMYLLSLKHELIKKFKNIRFKTFLNGEDCLKHINESPDIVILDYSLANRDFPDAKNGIDVLKSIKTTHPGTEVIILSAQDKVEVAAHSIRSGAYEYVVKSESAFVRLSNVVRKIGYTIECTHLSEKYSRWNYIMAALLLSFLAVVTIFYLSR